MIELQGDTDDSTTGAGDVSTPLPEIGRGTVHSLDVQPRLSAERFVRLLDT